MLDGLLRAAKEPEDISGPGGILDQLRARCVNRALEADMEMHLGHRLGERPSAVVLVRFSRQSAYATHLVKSLSAS